MSLFDRIEQACAAFVERTFARTFPSDLEPAQIARKLVATFEARTRDEHGGPVAPGGYRVAVNPSDYERLAEHRPYLEREWAELLRELAARVGIAFSDGDAKVRMSSSESVPLGAVDVSVAGERRARTRFRLRTIQGVPAQGVYSIRGVARVGRGDENEVVLADPSVSRSHALLDASGGKPFVRDLDSTNGTFVNGRRVATHDLQAGDDLTFGNTRLRFEVDE